LTVRGEGTEIAAPQVAAEVPEIPGAEYLVQLILSLLVVVITIVVVAWILRRLMRMQSLAGGNMRILAGLSLGSRERIVMVEAGDTQLLLGVAPGRVVALHVFDKPVFTQSTHPTGRFAKHLQGKIEGAKSA
jgi:flagellar protein FliO/FliZ